MASGDGLRSREHGKNHQARRTPGRTRWQQRTTGTSNVEIRGVFRILWVPINTVKVVFILVRAYSHPYSCGPAIRNKNSIVSLRRHNHRCARHHEHFAPMRPLRPCTGRAVRHRRRTRGGGGPSRQRSPHPPTAGPLATERARSRRDLPCQRWCLTCCHPACSHTPWISASIMPWISSAVKDCLQQEGKRKAIQPKEINPHLNGEHT